MISRRLFVFGRSLNSVIPDAQLRIADAPLGAGPESILPAVVMDSGLAQERAPE
jgi:hypothetical protein